MLQRCLEDLERRIDDGVEARLYADWRDFVDGGFTGDIFSPNRNNSDHPGFDWPQVRVNGTLTDIDAMLLQQYGACSDLLEQGTDQLLCVRANYGTAILPSLFGVEYFIMDDELNTLPTNWPIAGGLDGIKALLDRGLPDMNLGYGEKVFQVGERFMEIAKAYPKIGRHVHIYHPDLQGPMDVCELLWGSEIFVDIMDEPELVKDLLELVTETYIRFLRKWDAIVSPPTDGYAVHWAMLHKGHIMLRDDSAMNFSPDMYREFIMPHDQRLLKEFGGGALHFCGRGDHYITLAAEMSGLSAVNMSQPEYNDMEVIFQNTIDKGLRLLRLTRAAAEEALATGRALHGSVHSS